MTNPSLNQEYWQSRYEKQETGWDIGYASPALTEYFDEIRNHDITILIPGCGNAYEAEYLHNHGFTNLSLIDIAQAPLDSFKRRNPQFPDQNLIHGDFFALSGNYELIIEQTFFCALNPDLRSDYVDKMHDLLTPGGRLAGLLFSVEFSEAGPPFGGKTEDYLLLFQKRFEILRMEPCKKSIAPRMGRELFFELVKR